ncbi:MAG: restriction endonuclease [Pseudobdellovibrionaceae bacterium]
MEKNITLPEFLKKSYPEDPEWLSFAKWFLEARGFDLTGHENQLVDGAYDGGIDVIAKPKNGDSNKTYVIQSKYVRSAPNSEALMRFMGAVEEVRVGL